MFYSTSLNCTNGNLQSQMIILLNIMQKCYGVDQSVNYYLLSFTGGIKWVD